MNRKCLYLLVCLASFLVSPLLYAILAEPASEDESLAGEVERTEFRVNYGKRVYATEDLKIICSVDAVIDGLIIAKPGVSVEIVSPKIIIRGTIRGGDGSNRWDVLEAGQNGGDVILNSPHIIIEGGAIGRGGNAGPAGNGGNGGSIKLVGTSQVIADPTFVELRGGEAGLGGCGINGFNEAARTGGSGGGGGAVLVSPL